MRIEVNVRANSSREEVIDSGDGKYKVFLRKPAIENKANVELVKVMNKYFGKKVSILKGFSSNRKMLEVDDAD